MNIANRNFRAFENLGKEPAGSTVYIVDHEDFVTRLEKASDRGESRQSAGKRKGPSSVLQFCELLLENGPRWVATTRIIVFAELERAFLLEGRGLIDRCRNGAMRIARTTSRLHQFGIDFHDAALAIHAVLLSLQQASALISACSRSLMMSAGSSSPTESRIRPSGMPSAARVGGGISACVMLAGCVISVSAAPRFSASAQSLTDFINSNAAGVPPVTSNDNIPPCARCRRRANSYCGNDSNPG